MMPSHQPLQACSDAFAFVTSKPDCSQISFARQATAAQTLACMLAPATACAQAPVKQELYACLKQRFAACFAFAWSAPQYLPDGRYVFGHAAMVHARKRPPSGAKRGKPTPLSVVTCTCVPEDGPGPLL